MSAAEETRVLIAMDGSKYADYAFDCELELFISFIVSCHNI